MIGHLEWCMSPAVHRMIVHSWFSDGSAFFFCLEKAYTRALSPTPLPPNKHVCLLTEWLLPPPGSSGAGGCLPACPSLCNLTLPKEGEGDPQTNNRGFSATCTHTPHIPQVLSLIKGEIPSSTGQNTYVYI